MVRTAREVLKYQAQSMSECIRLVDMPRSEDDAQPVTIIKLDLGEGVVLYLAAGTASGLGKTLLDAAETAGNRNMARVRNLRESFGG